MPFGWPLIFAEFERKWYKTKERPIKIKLGFWAIFRILLRNPITLCYYLPIIGWLPLLIKGYSGKKKG